MVEQWLEACVSLSQTQRGYRDYIGIMEKKMETTVAGYIGFRVWVKGKENGKYYLGGHANDQSLKPDAFPPDQECSAAYVDNTP